MPTSPTITLFGAAGEVTGSCTLVECAAGRVLVDFGLFQGTPEDEHRNLPVPELDAARLDAVVVTHAHVDHCGRLGMLPEMGFRGPVICTPPTSLILPKVLRGSASLQAIRIDEFRNGTAPVAKVIHPPPRADAPGRAVREREPPVLYDRSAAERVASWIEALQYGVWRELRPGLRVRLHDAAHVLGSASVEIEMAVPGRAAPFVFLCSGDLGPAVQPLLRARGAPPQADVVMLESTNGARRMLPSATIDESLAQVLARAADARGKVVFPTFSLGRAQQIVQRLARLRRDGRLRGLPTYLDSPMAVFATELHHRFPELLAEEPGRLARGGEAPLHFPELHFLFSRKQSLKVDRSEQPAVILAGSGFCDAGPILHHLASALPRPECEVVLVGHQIEGTLGHGLVSGAELVQIGNARLEVHARRTRLEGFSGHGDQEDLLAWVRAMKRPPGAVVLNHGEDAGREALEPRLRQELGATVMRPKLAELVQLVG